jgi:hypothetical protein
MKPDPICIFIGPLIAPHYKMQIRGTCVRSIHDEEDNNLMFLVKRTEDILFFAHTKPWLNLGILFIWTL